MNNIYINKQAILNRIKTEFNSDETLFPIHFEDLIENIPEECSIEVNEGYWKIYGITNKIKTCQCPFCEKKININYDTNQFEEEYKYCRHCGAKLKVKLMDKKQAYEILKNVECFGAVELYQENEIEAFNLALETLKKNIDLEVEAEKEPIGE